MRWIGVAVLFVVAVLGVSACSGSNDGAPPAPAGNAQLTRGRAIWVERCARCHGVSGGGAIGPQLSNGKVTAKYPTPEGEIQVVTKGLGSMPAFGNTLSKDDIAAVVAYTREVLATR
ncbi:MAG: c-type cytochrome [Acidimicrobiia bacterium]